MTFVATIIIIAVVVITMLCRSRRVAAAVRRATAVDDVEVALGESKGHQGDDDEETTGKGKGYDAFFSWLMWKLKPKLKILVVNQRVG